MAEVIPFRGILYNPHKIHNLSDVVAPPYDVISREEQRNLYERHPQNIIRLILGRTTENDTDKNNRHTRATYFFNRWLSEGILAQDFSAAFYLTTVEFPFENRKVTRFGLITLVGLEPFEKGIILPHERTFSSVKSERLELMKACHANFCPIFSLYSGQNDILDSSIKDTASNKRPDISFTDDKGHRHRLWRIIDASAQRHVSCAMKEKNLFIADGHHRYEAALNYRDWMLRNSPDFSPGHPANYVMMCLGSMEDPGLTILPAHRMLTGIQDSTLATFIQKANDYFDVMTIPFINRKDRKKAKDRFILALKRNVSKSTIGVFMKDSLRFYLLTPKPDVMNEAFKDELSDSLRDLDVTVLTYLVFIKILDFDQSMLDDKKLIAYSSSAQQAIDMAASGKCDIAFILNPTTIEQVRNVARKGLVMPRKSTYFYPKVITGQVINLLNRGKTFQNA